MVNISIKLQEVDGKLISIEVDHSDENLTPHENHARAIFFQCLNMAGDILTHEVGGGRSMTMQTDHITEEQRQALVNAAKIKFFGNPS